MLGEVLVKDVAIDALLVIRNGRLVLESYRYPNTSTTLHSIYSCTKSFISALIGIALDHGKLKNVQQHVIDFFLDYKIANIDKAKKNMTIRDLLTMSGGFRWPGGMPEEPTLDEWTGSPDWVGYVLDRPLATASGTQFTYNSGGSHLLSAILQRAVGVTAEAFAVQYLFQPLGITDWRWQSDPQGVSTGGFGLRLRPLDMAKLGYLYLNQGKWGNRQVVPAKWCSESVQKQISAGGQWLSDGYGYQWWVDDQGYYMALGYGGQYIIVVPNRQLVVVVTSHLSTYEFFLPERLLQNYVLPACTSSGALPPNDSAVKLMNSKIQQLLANPKDVVTRQ
jgi:CubicO group peptidase (beta-lactamase class C family)